MTTVLDLERELSIARSLLFVLRPGPPTILAVLLAVGDEGIVCKSSVVAVVVLDGDTTLCSKTFKG